PRSPNGSRLNAINAAKRECTPATIGKQNLAICAHSCYQSTQTKIGFHKEILMIRSTRSCSLPCSFLIVAVCLSLSSRLPGAEPDRTRLAGIRARMQQFVDDKMIAGAVTVVGTHDQVLSLECVGSQNLDSGAAMQPETMFRI